MKNKLLVIIGIIVLIVPLMACSESAPPAQSGMASQVTAMWTASPTWNAYGDQIKILQDQMSKKADMSLVTELIKAGGGGGGNSYSKDEVYTKDQVNTTVGQAIEALKKDQSWIKTNIGGTGGGSGGIINPGDNVLATNGQLVLSLEKSVEEELYLADGDHQTFKLTITNNDSTSHTFRLKADFDCETAVPLGVDTILDTDYSYSDGATMKCNTVLPAASVTNIGFTSTRGTTSTDTTWYIGKARSESIYLSLTMDYTGTVAAKRWTWDFGLSQRD